MTRKHIWAGASLAAALVLGTATGAGAVPGPEVTRGSVTFTISSDDCSQVPAGTTLEGTGERISIGYERTDHEGIIRKRNTTHAEGTATDQDGNVYNWTYDHTFRVTNTLDDHSTYRGWFVDDFAITGDGPAAYEAGFAAIYADNFVDFVEFHPIRVYGDPLEFPSGPGHCDPI